MATPRQIFVVLISAAAAGLVSFMLTPLVRTLAIRWGFVDVPKDERRMHSKPIPTIGGLAIFTAFLLVTLLSAAMTRRLAGILVGALIIVMLGIADDKYDLNARLKFLIQILAALIPVTQGCLIEYISNPLSFVGPSNLDLGFLSIPVSILWIVGLTNAVNFIDGLDGLSAGVCSISCLTMGVIALILGRNQEALLLFVLLGSCIGFLPYNINPAKIFMGDTGATFLGFTLGCLSVTGLFKVYTAVSFAVPMMVLAIPLFDICFAFIRRLWHHVSPMTPDRSHIHHRLVDVGFSHRQTVTILYVLSALLGFCAVLLSAIDDGKALLFLIAIVVLGVAALWFLSWKQHHKK